jgi:hypothetical protein
VQKKRNTANKGDGQSWEKNLTNILHPEIERSKGKTRTARYQRGKFNMSNRKMCEIRKAFRGKAAEEKCAGRRKACAKSAENLWKRPRGGVRLGGGETLH